MVLVTSEYTIKVGVSHQEKSDNDSWGSCRGADELSTLHSMCQDLMSDMPQN